MEAIVLAGGLGTRLRSVVSDLPKPMAPVNNKPFLEYILRHLDKNGVNRVVICVGYKWEYIKEYFGDKFENIELIYSVEDKALGTGGAIKKAMEFVYGNQVYIINGDTFFNIDLRKLILKTDSKLVLSLKKMEKFDRYGCVETNESGKIVSFTEKSYKDIGNINGGIYLASKNIFDGFELGEVFSFEEFLQENFENLSTSSIVFEEYFIDIGIPENYKKAQYEIKKYI